MSRNKTVAGRGENMNYGNGIRHGKAGIVFFFLLAFAAVALRTPNADAQSQYYGTYCAPCHGATPTTCNGCHHHGPSGDQAVTDKTSYAPGETVTVTFTGGRSSGATVGGGWIRAILYLNNVEVVGTRSTGTGGMGGGPGFPITFTTTAPTSGSNLTYQVAWFGNLYDSGNPTNANHGEQRVTTNAFSITAPTSPTISTSSPLSAGTVGTAYSQTLAATGGTTPYSWSVSAGTLPAGLSLSAAGVLSGTPTSAATSSFTVQVTGANSASSTKAFSVTINAATPTGAVTITPADGATDVHVNTVVTARIGSGDIRTIFNQDTFTLKPGVAMSNSSMGPAGPLAASVCVSGGVVQGSITYNRFHTRARFTPNCSLEYNMMYVGEIAAGGGSSSASPQSFRFTTAVARPDSDDDGGDDGEDDHPDDPRKTGIWSPYGTGRFLIATGDNSVATIRGTVANSDTSSRLNQAGRPEGYEFPDGLVSFRAEGVAQGTSATFKVTFPSGIAAGSKVYQVDASGFHEVAGAVVAGDTVTMTVTNTSAVDGSVPVNPVGVAAPESSGTGSIDLSSASGGGGCSVAVRTGSGGSAIDGTLILAGLGMAVWGIRIRRRRG
jgi:hypothetical protein